jgi:uncharacterized membrane protein
VLDLVNGLPLHPLVVHGVVVLLPLAVLGTIAIAARPLWRRSYGHLVVAAAAVATLLIPVATSSGEALEKHVGAPGTHAALGDQLIWFALPLLVLDLALVVMSRRDDRTATTTAGTAVSVRSGRGPISAVAALSVVAALATGVQVYRVGDSGARAAWGDRVSAK